MFMRQKDGQQQCYRCQGKGCWGCERKGYVIQCPGCAARDQATRTGDDFKCGQCNTVFTKGGIVTKEEEKNSRKIKA